MTTWNFDSTIPATNNNPSQDQPKMLQNNVSIEGILDEDHYTFESTVNGNSVDGQHKNLRFPTQNALGAQTDPASGVYTTAGTASINSDLRFRNESGIFPLSALRACGTFTIASGNQAPVAPSNSFNVVSWEKTGTQVTIILNSNTINSDNATFLFNNSNGNSLSNIAISSAGQTVIFNITVSASTTFWFALLEI